MKILVTGGAGFIGSHVIRLALARGETVLNVDCLSYAANLTALQEFERNDRYLFKKINIQNRPAVDAAIREFMPDSIVHLAAESHVDRSIDGPELFIQTNIVGTFNLLQAALAYWQKLKQPQKDSFRFHHVSTDEVYGSLGPDGYFTETTAYQPASPYSASKAASDHLVGAWHKTYGLPTIITNCSNNYGPWQFPEKLIPLMIIKGLVEERLPVYGQGLNVRDWLYVDDHARAVLLACAHGRVGETYNIGGNAEHTNIDIVTHICHLLDQIRPPRTVASRADLITFVADRPGHDFRYAIDAIKIKNDLGWKPVETFETGLFKTVQWYVEHQDWWENIRNKRYEGERLGLKAKSGGRS